MCLVFMHVEEGVEDEKDKEEGGKNERIKVGDLHLMHFGVDKCTIRCLLHANNNNNKAFFQSNSNVHEVH